MQVSSTAMSTRVNPAQRIHLIAELACSLARSCPFSRDPSWFWSLAEAEIAESVEVLGEPTSATERSH